MCTARALAFFTDWYDLSHGHYREEVEKAIIARRNPTRGLEYYTHRGTGRTAYLRTYSKDGIDPS
ncbi:hypothetical protein BGY98DRAFT_1048084, partial [Russula aff. rugulosa BPL654]